MSGRRDECIEGRKVGEGNAVRRWSVCAPGLLSLHLCLAPRKYFAGLFRLKWGRGRKRRILKGRKRESWETGMNFTRRGKKGVWEGGTYKEEGSLDFHLVSRMVCSQDPESMQHVTFPLTKLCRTADTGYVSRHQAPHGTTLWPGAGLF